MRAISQFFPLLIIVVVFSSCRQEPKQNTNGDSDFDIHVRLDSDPGQIEPYGSQGVANASVIRRYIMQALADVDPQEGELVPVLIEKVVEGETVNDELHFTLRMRDEAKWDNGEPVTGYDMLFTINASLHPAVNAPLYKQVVKQLKRIEVDADNPKYFTLVWEKDTRHAKSVSYTIDVLPAYYYDPSGILQTFQPYEMVNRYDSLSQANLKLEIGISELNQKLIRDKEMVGSGGYELVDWETNQYLVLQRKKDWWGSTFDSSPLFKSNPEKLVFQFISDENTALTQLLNGSINLMTLSSGLKFQELKQNSNVSNIGFAQVPLPKYHMVALNNNHPVLRHKEVRKAIAKMVDVQELINSLEDGSGLAVTSLLPPSNKYYNDALDPITKDVTAAKELLESNGWTDTNANGTLDKLVDGKRVELKVDMYVNKAPLGQRIASLLRESGKEVGIDISVIQKDHRTIFKEHILTGKYGMYTLGVTISNFDYDPSVRYHSRNIGNGKTNFLRYNNPEADKIMEEIQATQSGSELTDLWFDLQRTVYEDQAAIYLYSATRNIVSADEFEPYLSENYPGFLINATKLKAQSLKEQIQ